VCVCDVREGGNRNAPHALFTHVPQRFVWVPWCWPPQQCATATSLTDQELAQSTHRRGARREGSLGGCGKVEWGGGGGGGGGGGVPPTKKPPFPRGGEQGGELRTQHNTPFPRRRKPIVSGIMCRGSVPPCSPLSAHPRARTVVDQRPATPSGHRETSGLPWMSYRLQACIKNTVKERQEQRKQ